jgi:hypothetical protein
MLLLLLLSLLLLVGATSDRGVPAAAKILLASPPQCESIIHTPEGVLVMGGVEVSRAPEEVGLLARFNVELGVTSSSGDEVWIYDIPPTPHTTHTTHLLAVGLNNCTRRAPHTVSTVTCPYSGKIPLPVGAHTLVVRLVDAQSRMVVGLPAVSRVLVEMGELPTLLADRIAEKQASAAEGAAELKETQTIRAVQYGAGLHVARLNEFPDHFIHPLLLAALETASLLLPPPSPLSLLPIPTPPNSMRPTSSTPSTPTTPLDRRTPRMQTLSELAVPVPNATDVWMLPIFSDQFITLLEEELIHAQAFVHQPTADGVPIEWTRPNTMNNYGFVLEELGLGPMLNAILYRVLAPVSRMLLPTYCGGGGVRPTPSPPQPPSKPQSASPSASSPSPTEHGTSLDSQHTFTIRYAVGEDTSLDKHMDQSAITLNICLTGARTANSNSAPAPTPTPDPNLERLIHRLRTLTPVPTLPLHVL